MALVITVAQQKGGAGKTMLAANLAAAMATDRRVCLLDIDPQRSLKRWHEIRGTQGRALPAITFSDVSGWRLRAELERLIARTEKRPARLVLNRAPATSKLRSMVEHDAEAAGYTVMANTLGNRAGFANAFAQGMGAVEAAPKSVAAQEILALLREIEGVVA